MQNSILGMLVLFCGCGVAVVESGGASTGTGGAGTGGSQMSTGTGGAGTGGATTTATGGGGTGGTTGSGETGGGCVPVIPPGCDCCGRPDGAACCDGGTCQNEVCAPCEPTFACGPKNCGMVDDGCGTMLNCDDPGPGDPVTCATEAGGETGPMTCGADHVCHCAAEGNSPEALALCQGATAEPAVHVWCVNQGGCTTALCGSPSAPKTPGGCIFSGQAIKPVPQDPATWILIWCCGPVQ